MRFEPEYSGRFLAIIQSESRGDGKKQQELGRKGAYLLTQMLVSLFSSDFGAHDSFSPLQGRARTVRAAFGFVERPRQSEGGSVCYLELPSQLLATTRRVKPDCAGAGKEIDPPFQFEQRFESEPKPADLV